MTMQSGEKDGVAKMRHNQVSYVHDPSKGPFQSGVRFCFDVVG